AEDGIRDWSVTGVQTCALPISKRDRGTIPIEIRIAGRQAFLSALQSAFSASDVNFGGALGGFRERRDAIGKDFSEAAENREHGRSEERRVGKEWRTRWAGYASK